MHLNQFSLNQTTIAASLVSWYRRNKRELPWRDTVDPYKIWLSEVILQQTRVVQGAPYYEKFIAQYPDVHSLARAPEEEVLRLWQGLGYYTRARNLHACAKQVVQQYNGCFPSEYDQLVKLKGVGNYTAAAIASFAFKKRIPVLDGNVHRVISRIFGVTDSHQSGKGRKKFQKLAEHLIEDAPPDIFNQAIMEFGALICTPKKPDCIRCVVREHCYACAKGLQKELPAKNKKSGKKDRYFYYLVLKKDDSVIVKKRSGKDIWTGLYDFYLIEKSAPGLVAEIDDPFLKRMLNSAKLVNESGFYKHLLTHQRIFAIFLLFELEEASALKNELKNQDLEWASTEKIKQLPKPILINKYLHDQIF